MDMNKNEFIKLFKSKNAPDIILHYCIEKGKDKNLSVMFIQCLIAIDSVGYAFTVARDYYIEKFKLTEIIAENGESILV